MSGITDPNEPYFKDGIWGWAATLWQRLISEGGRLFTALHGWDGAAWHRLPMLWGYSDRLYEDLGGIKAGDGTYAPFSTPVPAGEIHVVQAISLQNRTGARGQIDLRVHSNGTYISVALTLTPPHYDVTVFAGALCLKQGDRIRVIQNLCLNNDVLQGGIWGYKMLIAE